MSSGPKVVDQEQTSRDVLEGSCTSSSKETSENQARVQTKAERNQGSGACIDDLSTIVGKNKRTLSEVRDDSNPDTPAAGAPAIKSSKEHNASNMLDILSEGAAAETPRNQSKPVLSFSCGESSKKQKCLASNGNSAVDDKARIEDEKSLCRNPFEEKSVETTASKVSITSDILSRTERLRKEARAPPPAVVSNFDLVYELTEMLLKNPDIKNDQQEICLMSAEDAVSRHPKQDCPEKLLDFAYARFLERTLK